MPELKPPQTAYPDLFWPAFTAAGEWGAALAERWFETFVTSTPEASPPEPEWATENVVALDLATVRLRDFSVARQGRAGVICAPFSLHGAALADLAEGHSLVGALRAAGLTRLFVTDWRSADARMKYLGVDDYLGALNVLVDHIGGPVDLIGLCQGGWMALIYAARFPAKSANSCWPARPSI